MSVEVLGLVMEVKGIASYVGAFKQAENAELRLANAEYRLQKQQNAGKDTFVAENRVQGIKNKIMVEQLNLTEKFATDAVGAFGKIIQIVKAAVDAYVEFGKEVQNISFLAGVSAEQAGKMASAFHVAGINAAQGAQIINKLGADMKSGEAIGAMSRLGLAVNPLQSQTKTFDQVIDRLRTMKDGIQKSQIEMEIFGEAGAMALQPYLHMTAEQISRVRELSSVNGESVARLQQFQFQSALLGETFMQKIVYPFADALLPVLTEAVTLFGNVTDAVANFLKYTGGIKVMAIALGAVAGAVVVLAAKFVFLAGKTMVAAAAQMVLDAAEGNWVPLAAALAIGGTATAIGVSGGFGGTTSETAANTKAIQDNTAAIGGLKDSFDMYKGKALPGGLSSIDMNALNREMALGSLG